jgi:hypothetical protein
MRRWKLLRGGGNSPVAKHAEAAFSGARAACATLQTAAVPTHYLWRTLAPKLPRDLPRGALQAAVAGQIRLQRSLIGVGSLALIMQLVISAELRSSLDPLLSVVKDNGSIFTTRPTLTVS